MLERPGAEWNLNLIERWLIDWVIASWIHVFEFCLRRSILRYLENLFQNIEISVVGLYVRAATEKEPRRTEVVQYFSPRGTLFGESVSASFSTPRDRNFPAVIRLWSMDHVFTFVFYVRYGVYLFRCRCVSSLKYNQRPRTPERAFRPKTRVV